MIMWKACVWALVIVTVLGLAFNSYMPDLLGLRGGIVSLLLTTSLVGTPIVAGVKGRRWWLWLLIGLVFEIASLLAVLLAERPELQPVPARSRRSRQKRR